MPSRSEREEDDYPPRYRGDFDARRSYSRDEDHLRILSILHYVLGALSALYCSFPLAYVIFGVFLVSGMGPPGAANPDPVIVGWFMIGFGSAFVLSGWVYSACLLYAGYCLSRRRRYLYCFVMACVSCANMPLGTVLGIFTIIVLARPSVKELFVRAAQPRPARATDMP